MTDNEEADVLVMRLRELVVQKNLKLKNLLKLADRVKKVNKRSNIGPLNVIYLFLLFFL